MVDTAHSAWTTQRPHMPVGGAVPLGNEHPIYHSSGLGQDRVVVIHRTER